MDCSQFPGKLAEVCDGTARKADGTPFTDKERKTILARRLKTAPHKIDIELMYAGAGRVGDALHQIIFRETGSHIECGECRREISKLNSEPVSSILRRRESLAEEIVERGKTKAPKWWQRWGITLAPGIAKSTTLKWINEACGVSSDFSDGPLIAKQFVWFYINGPEDGKELKLSIESVKKNFIGIPNITVVGDKPSWYQGHHIPDTRLEEFQSPEPNRRSWRDTQKKIMLCAYHPEIQKEFVWTADDVFMMRPTSIEDIQIPRYDPWYEENKKTEWHRLIQETFAALRENGKSTLQYGTHLPHVFEKSKLSDLFGVYGFPKNLYLFEILYQNHFKNPDFSIPYGGNWNGVTYPQFLRRLLSPLPLSELNKIETNFLNYQSGVWNSPLKSWLESAFGNSNEPSNS